MGLNKYHLGDLLERNTEYNEHLEYGIANVRGVLNSKEISDTKVDVTSRDLSKFLVVRPDGFIFNHRVHDKLGLGFNSTQETFIFTNDYVSFYVKKTCCRTILLPEYLFIWFLRPEFDRYMLFKTYGSATLFFNWDNMCELEIVLPDISIQQKYVAIYQSMVANQQSYESGLEDLKLVCDGYIEDLRRKMPCEKIGAYLIEKKDKNASYTITKNKAASIEKTLVDTHANLNGVDIRNYLIVRERQFAYNTVTTRNGDKISIALNDSSDCLVSPIYTVFDVDNTALVPEYLMLWFKRSEFDRYARYHSWGSAREMFSFDDMSEVQIPIPDIKVQKAIAEIYSVYTKRKKTNEQLKEQIKNICPIFIKGSVEEAT